MAQDYIELHPEKGLNPRLTCCRQCGADVGVALMGAHDGVYECSSCGAVHVGKKSLKCGNCGASRTLKKTGKVLEHQRIPLELCDNCQAKNAECNAAVEAGGIFWRCADCKSQGALKAGSDIAKAVRNSSGIEAPKPVGVEFTKADSCPVCSDKKVEEV